MTSKEITDTIVQSYEMFELATPVDCLCGICTNVLRNPVKCANDKHYFCRDCITQILQHSPNCPTCKDPLTAEALVVPSRDEILAYLLSRFFESLIFVGNIAEYRAKCKSLATSDIIVAGGESNVDESFECEIRKTVEAFSLETQTWHRLNWMNERRKSASSFEYQGRIFVAGGWNRGWDESVGDKARNLDTVEELGLHGGLHGCWLTSPLRLPETCHRHASVVYGDHLIVIGGIAGSALSCKISEMQLYPPYSVRELARMPSAICYHAAEIVNGKIYIIGGSYAEERSKPSSTVLVFDPETNQCSELEPLPYPVERMASATWNDNVIIIGGKDNQSQPLDTVMMFNVTTKSFHELPRMKKRRYACTAVNVGAKIVVVGGIDETDTVLKSAECYSFETGRWSELPHMLRARSYATAVAQPKSAWSNEDKSCMRVEKQTFT